ncbi:hypothetical protein N7488_008927 [Penicillium malachiteum]|nr:hypothetical protein N7488_008927 [Penicillium malachiteum]
MAPSRARFGECPHPLLWSQRGLMNTKDTSLDIHDSGRSLFGDMCTSPYSRDGKETRIILVGHSMGGLAFLLAHQDPHAQDLADRIKSIFFLATPHRGTGADRLQLWSFYETLKTRISSSNSGLIVDHDSADLRYKEEQVQLLNADHRGVCKFQSPSDPKYHVVQNSLAKTVEYILGDIVTRKADETRSIIRSLEFYLAITSFAEDDLVNLQSVQAEGSCNWITEQLSIQNWWDTCEDTPHVYWLTGQLRSGKSVMAAHIVTHLQELGVDFCYYFFKQGHKEQKTVSGFLRQLAYQMAVHHLALTMTTRELFGASPFVKEILKTPLLNQQFWVVDGLDECHDVKQFFVMLSKLDSTYEINFFFSSRKVQLLERQFASFGNRVFSHNIKPDDKLQDIRSYIENHCDFLAVDLEYRHGLVDTMEIENVYSENSMSEVLAEIPERMAELYKQVLNSMSQNSREAKLTKAILAWTVCGVRNLTVNELQAAMRLDLKSNIPNIESTVESLCGQMLRIEKNGTHIVTSGNGSLRMWSVDGNLLWSLSHLDPVVPLTFSQNDYLFFACTNASAVICHSVMDGAEVTINSFALRKPDPGPGRSPQLWSLEKDVLVGTCEKQAFSDSQILFNPNPSVEILAVTYQDGELALFRTWNQEEVASESGEVYIMAAIVDGRTIATGDMLGTIKLWDFGSLHLLYCINSPDYEIRSLTFSGDRLRFFDIRDTKSKIWEPAVLARKRVSDDSSVSDSASGSEMAVAVGNYGETVDITVMLVSQEADYIFFGKDDGSIHSCHIASGFINQLYSHLWGLLPTCISWSPEAQLIATGDTASSLVFWRLEKQSRDPTRWKFKSKIFEIILQDHIRELSLSPDGSHLLVHGSDICILRLAEPQSNLFPLKLSDPMDVSISQLRVC